MRNKLKINTIDFQKDGTKIVFGYTYDKGISKYFNSKEPFFVVYDGDISSIPKRTAFAKI